MPAAARAQTRTRPVPRTEPRAPRPRPQPRARRAAPRPRLAGSVAWIGLVAALLAGIVALNVAVLGLNVEAEKLDARKQELVAARDSLASQLSRAAAAGRIEAIATRKLGFERPAETTYVRLGRAER
ncbi:MAG TPA: hypothetical protein VHF23_06930 [Gaiellaceae bacterium]|nr:hypothetical protein [Gaiellaceae bacterium]